MTIKDISDKTGLTEYTLRYYEKVGVLPSIKRNRYGQRDFTESDLAWIDFLLCLKATGLPIRGIRKLMQLWAKGDDTIPDRLTLLKEHRKDTIRKMEDLQLMLAKLNGKIEWYEKTLDQQSRDSTGQKHLNGVQSA